MLRLIERSIEAIDQDLVLVAPPHVGPLPALAGATADSSERQRLIAEVQRLRGAIYLNEGNITATQLTPDGRHQTPEDERGWHLLMTNPEGEVAACALYMEYPNTISAMDLRMEWLGRIGYQAASAIKPGIVFCSVICCEALTIVATSSVLFSSGLPSRLMAN